MVSDYLAILKSTKPILVSCFLGILFSCFLHVYLFSGNPAILVSRNLAILKSHPKISVFMISWCFVFSFSRFLSFFKAPRSKAAFVSCNPGTGLNSCFHGFLKSQVIQKQWGRGRVTSHIFKPRLVIHEPHFGDVPAKPPQERM